MPCVQVKLNVKLNDNQKKELLKKLLDAVAEVSGKPKAYIMVTVDDGVALQMGESDAPCAFVDYRAIGGINGENNKKASGLIAKLLGEFKIESKRVYIAFTNYEGSNWGYNGSTF